MDILLNKDKYLFYRLMAPMAYHTMTIVGHRGDKTIK